MVRLLQEQAGDLAARVGAPVELVGVAVRRLDAPREVEVPDGLLTTDAEALVARDDVDLVVEVIGGIEPARSLILAALENGASVVTANKALLAEDGPTLFEAAEKAGRDLYYEAAVAGAIPILRPLRESLAGDTRHPGARHRQRHHQLHPRQDGHLRRRASPRRWRRPRSSGTPRPTRPPTSRGSTPPPRPRSSPRLAFHSRVTAADVHREGITEVTAADVAVRAATWARVVKLLAICELATDDGRSSPSACTPR